MQIQTSKNGKEPSLEDEDLIIKFSSDLIDSPLSETGIA